MAYNDGYTMGYGRFDPYQGGFNYRPTTPAGINQPSGPIWVQGEAGAKSFLVAPNTTVALWDSEAQVIYLKSADASGMPSMRVIDYTIRGGQPVNHTTEYATKEDLEKLRAKIAELKKSLKGDSYE